MDLISSKALPTRFSLPLTHTGLLHSTHTPEEFHTYFALLIHILKIMHYLICPKSLKLPYFQTMALYSRDTECELSLF